MDTLRHLFLQHLAPTSDAPMSLDIVSAQGVYLHARDGKKYIDFISGIGVSSYGHGNHAIIEAIKNQAEKHLHLMVYGEYIQQPQVALAQKLATILPTHLQSMYFVNSGSEATEGAMKLAKRVTGRSKIIAAKNAYHGSTQGALSLMDGEYYTQAYRPLLPQIEFITYNDIDSLDKITTDVAAVIIETIQGEAGYEVAALDFFKELRNRCDQTGTLLIFDEIQCGMGRTGTWFAFEQMGVVPDILLLAKAFGAGMPLGAFIASQKLMTTLSHSPVLGHITTFGGHPVSCAAALAGINFVETEGLMATIPDKEALLRDLLSIPQVKGITGRGLMLALDFGNESLNKKIITGCIHEGLITDWFLHCGHKMRLAPPLTISDEEIRLAGDIIKRVAENETV